MTESDMEHIKFYTVWATILTFCIMFWMLLFSGCNKAFADEIDLHKIMMIESSGNPFAHNKRDDSRGLFQITPICLKEYNNFHSHKYTMEDLWKAAVSAEIADWYLNVRIPQMLRHYGKPVTVENQIVAYNAGISYVIHNKPLPITTMKYIEKYRRMK